MRNLVLLAVFLVAAPPAWARPLTSPRPLTPKQRFLADNPGYKERAGDFYAKEYLPGAVRSMTEAIRSPGFRDADAERILRGLIGNFLDGWIEAGGPLARGHHDEIIAAMDVAVQDLVGAGKTFDRYLTWRLGSGVGNPLAFLLITPGAMEMLVNQAKQPRPIRVLVADGSVTDSAIADRLRQLKFEVVAVAWNKLDPDQAKDVDVIFLATHWGDQLVLPALEAKKDALHRFVQRGGGLVASQPNPAGTRTCTPTLLPYPITFDYRYDQKDRPCVNVAQDHFITEDLPDTDMPFPHDALVNVDPRYRVLAKHKSTDRPCLVACPFGDGRVVVQTNNETYGANIRLGDEILRRMLVWAAGKEPRATTRR